MSSSWHITYDILVIVSAAEQPARRSLSIQKWKVSDPAILGDFAGPAPGPASLGAAVRLCMPPGPSFWLALGIFQPWFWLSSGAE